MAVCEMWDVKGRLENPINYATNKEKTSKQVLSESELQALKDIVSYTSNEHKTFTTDKEYLVSSLNCSLENARDTMLATKTFYADKKSIVAFHGFQSFKPGEVTPDLAHKIGVELAKKLWGERFEVVISTHLNTDCMHNHFVINSTSFKDGKRFYDNKKTLKLMRKVSDELCRQYELSVIENPVGNKVAHSIYKANLEGKPTKLNIAKETIDLAISRSYTKEDFFKELTALGCKYDFRDRLKYPTITLSGFPKAVRLARLGSGYSKEDIFKRIEENDYSVKFTPIQPAVMRIGIRNVTAHSFLIAKRRSGLKGLYLHYCYRLGILPKNANKINNAKMHYLLRDDLLKLDRITAQTKLLFNYQIDTKEQLFNFKDNITKELGVILCERKKLNNSLRYADENETAVIKEKVKKISQRIKQIRLEVKHCDEIILRSTTLESDLIQVEKDEQTNEKEMTSHEPFRGRSRADS